MTHYPSIEIVEKAERFGLIDSKEANRRIREIERDRRHCVNDLIDLVMQAERLGSVMVVATVEKGGDE